MPKTQEGSTTRLLQLCAAYYFFYVVTGVAVKYFRGPKVGGYPGLGEIEYMAYSTAGGTAICMAVVLIARWRLKSSHSVRLGPLTVPAELLYIVPSGICTAVVIPTTTLLYTFPIPVMVAMVIMRGAVIVVSRLVDAIQIRQGILHRRVYWEEDAAVGFALAAVASNLLWGNQQTGFSILRSVPALVTLGSYVVAYFIRIYIMNYYKNTRPPGTPLDNKGFFALEQISAAVTLGLAAVLAFHAPRLFDTSAPQLVELHRAIASPPPSWLAAVLSGTAFGAVAFFSVFIFMFKGRTATFAGLVNRLTSLVAGTTASLLSWLLFGGRLPTLQDWISLGFILVAVAFLSRAERRRAREAK